MDYEKLAELLFPSISYVPQDMEEYHAPAR